MKLKQLLFAAALMAAAGATAQSVPTHDMYVDFGITAKESIVAALDKWQPGENFSDDPEYMDENFFITRVPLKKRFVNAQLQGNKDLKDGEDKNLCWCSPIGEMTKQWGPLPRYNFDADNFNMWQYLNIHANWSNSWWRVPGAFNDAAHRNGVRTGCLYFIDWASQVSESSESGKPLADLCVKENGEFKYARKLIQFLRYYGIDGIGLNPEGYWSSSLNENFQDFLAECHKIAEEYDFPFHVEWYAFVSNTGGLTDNGCELGVGANDKWFHKNGYPVTDVFFLNYNWDSGDLTRSAAAATSLGRSSYDVYAGFDQQGRGYGKSGNAGWKALMDAPVSITVWGAHDRSQLYANSTENGTSDLSVQKEYQQKQEMLFTGGTRNVLNRPELIDTEIKGTFSDLKKWHGYSTAVIEESALSEIPFVTRFGLGNGPKFYQNGTVSFDHKWYNIGVQDYLPTWRWWIDNGDGKTVPAKSIACDFNYDDAWYAGNSLQFHGETDRSDVRLFSTRFDVNSGDDYFTLTFKPNDADPKMQLMVSKTGSDNTFEYYTIPAEKVTAGKWNTITIKASELNLKTDDQIACIGLSFRNTTSTYSTLLGELGFIPASFDKKPVTPVITKTKIMKRYYNRADFKVVFDMPFDGERKAEYEGCPVYNEEVNTWYYEIYIKQGEQETLLTTTTSWAAYVVDAPLKDAADQTFQIGVRAVGMDGKTASEITWSDKLESELSIIEDITVDKQIIKPNEEFTIGFDDPNHAASTINIYNSLTGEKITGKEGILKYTTSLPTEGTYDVEVISDGKSVMNRSLLLISPEATGRLPQINAIQANPNEVEAGQNVELTVDANQGVTYDNGKACSVSKSLYMKEPYQLTVDSKVLDNYTTNSFALWFKVEKFEHASLGTLLMTKVNRNYAGTWTEQVWGEMWTAIRPENYSKYKNAANELSVSVDAPKAGTPNYEHNNEVDGISEGYTLSPGVWYHVCVVKDNKNVKLYLNGKKIIDVTSRGTGPKDWMGAQFYVGGSMTNLASFTGWVDEVQLWNKALTDEEVVNAMKGFRAAPEGLQGYFTFEDQRTDQDGFIYFPNKGKAATVVQGAYMTIGTSENGKTVDQKQNQLTTDLGVPSITGNQKITFESVKWILDGAQFTSDENGNATAQYNQEGKYPVTVSLTNSWGTTTKTIEDYIVVTPKTGIEETEAENFYIYPNPFEEIANILFAQKGDYEVNVFDTTGKQIAGYNYHADNKEVCTLSFDAPAGMYYVVVMQNGKCLQSFKVIKKL